MYSPESLHSLPGAAMHALLLETHRALIGLLWSIEELRKFDDSIVESHFDDSIFMERAQQMHRLLAYHTPKEIIEGDYLTDERDAFVRCWHRCEVGDSFVGGKAFTPTPVSEKESEA